MMVYFYQEKIAPAGPLTPRTKPPDVHGTNASGRATETDELAALRSAAPWIRRSPGLVQPKNGTALGDPSVQGIES
jgi:hypothetical protein